VHPVISELNAGINREGIEDVRPTLRRIQDGESLDDIFPDVTEIRKKKLRLYEREKKAVKRRREEEEGKRIQREMAHLTRPSKR